MQIHEPQENYQTGWIKIFRSIRNHWIWSNPHYFHAWITILLEVNHRQKKVIIHGQLLECKRGESLNSISRWATVFSTAKGKRWTVQNVRTFFKLLQKDLMIELKGEQKSTRLTVCNYDNYQNFQQANNKQLTSSQRAANEQLTTNNNVKNDNNVKNEKNITFEIFWKQYDKKREREKCFKKWCNLKPDEIATIFQTLPDYITSTPDKQFRKDPATYLNNKCWNDETIVKTPARKIDNRYHLGEMDYTKTSFD